MPPIYVNSAGEAGSTMRGSARAVQPFVPPTELPPNPAAAANGARALPPPGAPTPGTAISTQVTRPPIDMGMAQRVPEVSRMGRLLQSAGKVAGPLAVGATGADVTHQVATTPTEDYYARTGIDPVATHVPQLVKDIGVRSLGALQDLGNSLTFGMADRAGNALAGNGFGHSTAYPSSKGPDGATSAPPLQSAKIAPPNAASTLRAGLGVGSGGDMGPPAPVGASNPNGIVRRDGNSFSGENIREGFSYQDARTGMVVTTPEGRVTTMPAGTMGQLDPSTSARLHEARLAALDRGESLGPGGVVNMGGGGMRGNMRDSGAADIQKLAESGRLTATGLNAVLGARGQDVGAQTAQGQMGVQSQGQLLQHDAALRGQDVAMIGHQMSSQVARTQARMQQMQQDRQYGLEVAKFGEEKAKSAFTQREQATKSLQSRFEGQLVDPATGKPDAGRVAEHMGAVNSFMADAIAKAEAVPKGSPDYEQAQAMAEKLRTEGVKAIGEDRLQQITLGLKAKQLNAQNSSPYNPWKGTQVNSSNPADYAINGVERNTFTPDQYIHANGARTPVNVIDRLGGSPVINIGAPKSTEFDRLKGSRQ